MEQLTDILYKQAPVIIVMGVGLWWISKRYLEKDKQLIELSKEFIQLSVKLHEWLDKGITANKEDTQKVIDKLDQIHDLLKSKK